jgi:hypothetical protein
MKTNRVLATTTGLLIGGILIWISLRQADLGDIVATIRQANLWYAPVLVLTYHFVFWFKSARWALFLRPVKKVSATNAFPPTAIGYMGNLVLPAYLGEVGRAFVICKHLHVPFSAILGTLILERLVDILTLLLCVLLLVTTQLHKNPQLETSFTVLAIISALMLLVILLAVFKNQQLLKLVKFFTAFSKNIQKFAVDQTVHIVSGLQSIRHAASLTAITFYSVLQWILTATCIYIALHAVGLDLPVSAAFLVMILIIIGMSLPGAPGFFGTIQVCFTIGLQVYNVDASTAFSASIYFHALIYIYALAAGMISLWYVGSSPREVFSSAHEEIPGDQKPAARRNEP